MVVIKVRTATKIRTNLRTLRTIVSKDTDPPSNRIKVHSCKAPAMRMSPFLQQSIGAWFQPFRIGYEGSLVLFQTGNTSQLGVCASQDDTFRGHCKPGSWGNLSAGFPLDAN